jgi:fibronectin type 3 domain-containing protein/predicted small lipoprotein YifL
MSYDLMGRGWTARPIVRAGDPGMKALSALAAALAIALALAACGKEGPPTPPLRAVPAPVKDLAVHQRGTHVLLSFTYPQTTPGGAALNGVTKVEVYEAVLQPPPPLKAPAKAPEEKKPGGGKAAGGATAPPAAGKAEAKATGAGAGAAAAAEAGAASSTGTGAAASGVAGSEAASSGAGGSASTEPGAAGTPAGAAAATTGKTAAAPAAGSAAASALPSPLDPRQYEGLAKLRLTLTSKDLGAATLGNQLIIDLPLPEPLPAATATAPAAGPPGTAPGTTPAKVPPGAANAKAAAGAATATATAGLTRDYAVRAYGPQGDRSAFSNQALLMPKEPPQAPEGVTVTPQADGILVVWKRVADGGGYAVYRRAATERFSSKPLALVRGGETRHLDQTARFGQSYIYSVTTVDLKQPLVESAIKAEQEIRYVDVYPPPVPEELVAVAEAGRARLVWRQSEAPDLAGYIVYRKGATGDFVRLTAKPIAATNYVDTAVVSGQAYDYRVTAIDQIGNESAPSAEVHVAVP